MEVPHRHYTYGSFREYLLENSRDVFGEEVRKKWIKIYCLLVADKAWKSTLFEGAQITELGDVTEVRLRNPETSFDENYYIVEPLQGLLFCYTSATKASYEETLAESVSQTRGITQMNIRRGLFENAWRSLLDKYEGRMYRFGCRRSPLDSSPAEIRPNIERKFNYRGSDAAFVVKELREIYGVWPTWIYFRVSDDLIVQLTDSGLFSAKAISPLALEIFDSFLNTVKDEILRPKITSEQLHFSIGTIQGHSGQSIRAASVQTGMIYLKARPLDGYLVEKMALELSEKGFSVFDLHIKQGSLGFVGTVVDRRKDSVFDISGSEDTILLLPKYRTTFESFLDFYNHVSEVIDTRATFSIYSDGSSRK